MNQSLRERKALERAQVHAPREASGPLDKVPTESVYWPLFWRAAAAAVLTVAAIFGLGLVIE